MESWIVGPLAHPPSAGCRRARASRRLAGEVAAGSALSAWPGPRRHRPARRPPPLPSSRARRRPRAGEPELGWRQRPRRQRRVLRAGSYGRVTAAGPMALRPARSCLIGSDTHSPLVHPATATCRCSSATGRGRCARAPRPGLDPGLGPGGNGAAYHSLEVRRWWHSSPTTVATAEAGLHFADERQRHLPQGGHLQRAVGAGDAAPPVSRPPTSTWWCPTRPTPASCDRSPSTGPRPGPGGRHAGPLRQHRRGLGPAEPGGGARRRPRAARTSCCWRRSGAGMSWGSALLEGPEGTCDHGTSDRHRPRQPPPRRAARASSSAPPVPSGGRSPSSSTRLGRALAPPLQRRARGGEGARRRAAAATALVQADICSWDEVRDMHATVVAERGHPLFSSTARASAATR